MKLFQAYKLISALMLLASSEAFAHDMSSGNLKVAVLLFEGVEEIDYAGPIEAFGASGAKVFTVGQTKATVESVWGLKVTPDYEFSDAPEADVLVVPGGGIKAAWKNPMLLGWVKERAAKVKVVMSVCSGAFILGKAGLLDGIPATTTASLRSQLAAMFPTATVKDKRFVDAGKIITTAGLSAGIDGTLYLIERQSGKKQAEAAASYMEYDWKPSLN
ncbi:DJ-1/PfpI family protein [Duganella callida]|uniref:DJ-1/PfpI family protein n=1 Tax=Duganella callida TaxID=2561932 RepID=A0A4Y9ST63_9BURK|nr:DJ-1/PfpI family protein [Duganella callida]TFW28414.1 DJ-1/PfpI family protein [Duganella callida]